jgi:hypothetical protein
MPYGAGTRFFSPRVNGMSVTYPESGTLVFTDAFPYEDVGQFGMTADDARNEAYGNVPRVQVGGGPRERGPADTRSDGANGAADATAPAVRQDPRSKAIPLLNWAKAERERNPALYRALLQEARKHDAGAVEMFEREGK